LLYSRGTSYSKSCIKNTELYSIDARIQDVGFGDNTNRMDYYDS
jgi:hypothetical protein